MEQLFGAIPAVLGGLGANEGINEAVVFAAWQRCAGELLNERTTPIELFENRLVVAVADETWQRHLEDLSPQMLYKLNSSLSNGTVKFIEFRINEKAVNAVRENNEAVSVTDNKPIDMIFRATNVFENRNGNWLIIHEHLSFPVDPVSG